jgi:hypothetical protein
MKNKVLTFGILGLFAIALVSAGLVELFSEKTIQMEVESPVVLNGDLLESVSLIAGDGYNLYLVEGENKLSEDLDVNVNFGLLDSEGNELTDTTGFYLAYSDDLQYAYNEAYGNVSTWEDAQTWMFDNLDWFDWYLSNDLIDYDSSVITNHGGNSAVSNALAYNTNIPVTLSPGIFYAVVYMDVDSAVTPGSYQFNVGLLPA